MNKIKSFVLVLAVALGLSVCAQQVPVRTVVTASGVQQTAVCQLTNPLDIVARPNFYLNKTVKIKAKFDKFSTLGLDYKPAMRSSENYISFLIQRPDVQDHNIPLSELKIFLNRTEAEKHIELNSGDPWMDAETFTVISTKPKENNK